MKRERKQVECWESLSGYWKKHTKVRAGFGSFDNPHKNVDPIQKGTSRNLERKTLFQVTLLHPDL